jgi:hypothetical protein
MKRRAMSHKPAGLLYPKHRGTDDPLHLPQESHQAAVAFSMEQGERLVDGEFAVASQDQLMEPAGRSGREERGHPP